MKTNHLKLYMARAIAAAGGIVLWFTSLKDLPLVQVIALKYLSPFLILAGAYFFFRERLDRARILAILLAMTGAIIITASVLRETLAHDSVTVEDVTEFVRWVYTERLRQQVLDEEIAVTVSQILPPPGVTGAEYLRALGARAEQVAAKLIRDLGTP